MEWTCIKNFIQTNQPDDCACDNIHMTNAVDKNKINTRQPQNYTLISLYEYEIRIQRHHTSESNRGEPRPYPPPCAPDLVPVPPPTPHTHTRQPDKSSSQPERVRRRSGERARRNDENE